MKNTNRKTPTNGKLKIILTIILSSIVLCACIAGGLIYVFTPKTPSPEVVSIELSSSCGENVNVGGSGEVYALLRYDDGHTEKGDFVYKSDDSEAIAFDKENSGSFTAKRAADEVKITVTCPAKTQEKATISIKVLEMNTFAVTFKYPSTANFDEALTKSTTVKGGESVKAEDVPQLSYGCHKFKWVVKQRHDEEFKPSQPYYWNEHIVAEAQFIEEEITFVDEMLEGSYQSQTVTYGAETNTANWAKPSQTTVNGWSFAGWYPNAEQGEMQNGLSDGKFLSQSNTLYARWTANVELDSSFKTENAVNEALTVVYNSTVNGLVTPKYGNDGVFVNWYVKQENGTEVKIANGDKYTFGANDKIYAKVKFPVTFDYQGCTPKAEEADKKYYITYGDSFDANIVLPSPAVKSEGGWTFTGWNSGIGKSGIDWTPNTKYDANLTEAKSGILTLYAVRTTTFTYHRQLDENGAATTAKVSDTNIVYNAPLEVRTEQPIEVNANQKWQFGGYYTVENGLFDADGNADKRVPSVDNYKGDGEKELYAKWTSDLKFNQGLVGETSKSLGQPTKDTLGVIYNGRLSELPVMSYANNVEGIAFKGWFTQKFGDGKQLTQDEIYRGAPEATFYGKTEIDVTFNKVIEDESSKLTVTYGKTIQGQSVPELTHAGWKFEEKWMAEGLGEVTSETLMANTYDHNKPMQFDAVWSTKIKYEADKGNIVNVYGGGNEYYTVRYNQALNLDSPFTQGSWSFGGWYENADLSGNAVNFTSTSDSAFLELAANNNKTNAAGEVYVPLYAKWVNTVNLDYGMGYTPSSDMPAALSLVYGKTIADSKDTQSLPEISDADKPAGYKAGIGWFADGDFTAAVNAETFNYPLNVDAFYYKWEGKAFKVQFDYKDKFDQQKTVGTKENIIYGAKLDKLDETFRPTENTPTDGIDVFLGYFYVSSENAAYQYYDAGLNGVRKWDITPADGGDTVILQARFGKSHTVTLNPNGGSGGTPSVTAVPGQRMPTATAPTRVGYKFTGYYDSKTLQIEDNKYYDMFMNSAYVDTATNSTKIRTWDKDENTTLYAGWEVNTYFVWFHSNGGNAVSPDFIRVDYNTTYGALPNPTRKDYVRTSGKTTYTTKYTFAGWYTDPTSGELIQANNLFKKASNQDLYAHWSSSTSSHTDPSCFITGTLLTLADGSQKRVEELKLGDSILTYNHFEGRYEAQPISLLFAKRVEDYPILGLSFANGKKLEVVNMHGLYDRTLNKYVMLDYDNAKEFLGHEFVAVEYVNGVATTVGAKLISAEITHKTVDRYTLTTAYNINHVANGLLAVSDEAEGFFNLFGYDQNMKYLESEITADIAAYGLTDYDGWSEYVTYEEYLVFNGKYLNIAVAKNLTTVDKVMYLINTYVYEYGRRG